MPDDIEILGNNEEDYFTWVYDPNALGKDNVTPEDLFVWVSFRALPKSRSVIETDGTYSSSFFDSKGVQFISTTTQNGKDYMTTNYTNIGGANTGEKESFGIQNISVEYGASIVPRVKMTFVDVRGAGLFNGYEFEDEKGMKYNSSEFSTFFRLPYPIFELSVKGFYGKAITYCLHLVKWSARFDADGGNFIIDAEFVGFTFAFLSDVLLKYVMAVTATENGESALAKQNTRRRNIDSDSNQIIPIDEFVMSLGKLTNIGKDLKSNSNNYKELVAVNSVLFQVNKLQKSVGNPVNENITSLYGALLPYPQLRVNIEQIFVRDVGLISESSKQIHDIIVEDIGKFVKEYNSDIDEFTQDYSYMSKYKVQNFDIQTPAVAYEINKQSETIINDEVLKDGISEKRQTVTADILRSRLSLAENSTKAFYIINYHNFRKEVNDLLAKLQEKQAELQRIVNTELNERLGQQLGFDLSVESVFNIILGNVEAYLDVVYNVALRADDPNIQDQRISRLSNVRNDINEIDNRIYPFPAVFDSDSGEEVWIGDIVGENNPVFPEIQFIKEVINSLVAVNTKFQKDRERRRNKNLYGTDNGWIPVSPMDYENNPFGTLDNLSYNGNVVPQELAEILVTRALFAYEATSYNDARFNNIAKTEGAYSASVIENNVVKQVLKNYDNAEFVEQVINLSGFPNKDNISEIQTYSLVDGKGVLVGGFGDDSPVEIEEIVGQPKRDLSSKVDKTFSSFGKSLERTLVTNKVKTAHRKLDANGLYVYGDASDLGWSSKVFKNLRKFYKAKTSNDLTKSKPLDSPLFSTVNDLTIFDGQINATVDYSKSNDKELKFKNNARQTIGNNLMTFANAPDCLFNTIYYKNASDVEKAYYYLCTLPIDNISEIYEIFEVGGVYKVSRSQFAWFAGQFYRANEVKKGQDFFELNPKEVPEVENTYGSNRLTLYSANLKEIANKTSKYLPNLDDFSEEFIDSMVFYYEKWVEDYFLDGSEKTLNELFANSPDKTIEKIIGYIADFEQFYNYKPYGFTRSNPQVFYGYTGSKPISQITRDEAIELYKDSYYDNVKILPLAMRPVALDIHVNQGDHIGLVIATAERLGGNIIHDYFDVSDIWFGEGIYVGDAQKRFESPVLYKQTKLYQEYSIYKSEVERIYNQDPERFLDELTKTRLMRYSRTDGRDTVGSLSGNILFQEWSWRSLAILQFTKDLLNNNVQSNSYYFGSGSIFVKNGINLSTNVNNASTPPSAFNETWFTVLRQEVSKWLVNVPAISVLNPSNIESIVTNYCALTVDGINVSSSDYKEYKNAYNLILASIIDTIDIVVANPQAVVKRGTELYTSLGLKTLDETTLRDYITKWLETLKKLITVENNERKSTEKPKVSLEEKQEFYLNDKDMKLATYKHFKNLYDKWIGGSRNEQLHNVCSGNSGTPRDSMLIDRFHFIDRTWSHIGDKAVINPKPIQSLSNNADIDLYSFIGNIMKDSKFDFHVLPSWVNYKNLDDVRQMWKPQTDVENASSGAAYICMYMGGRSKVLDIGKKVGYVNDGFDLRGFDKNIPKGFTERTTPRYINNLEDNEKFKYNMVAFRVSYADQNQSIFKGISVSQDEHKETAESLQAISDAVDNRGGTKRFYKGVNLYNVFALRSYKCTVKTMGNMMIHPLTYFQLDNVPFFHGAYIITKVKHDIRAHYIETEIEGARMPVFIVPIVEFPTTYVNIPLNDTLFTKDELNESIVRPLQAEDPQSFASDGESTNYRGAGEGVPTSSEILEAQTADNSLLQVTFEETGQEFNFYIKPNLTEDDINSALNRVYNPNNPIVFKGVGLGNCYGWVKRSLNEVGVVQSNFFGIDAWTFYSGWDDAGTIHVTDEQFQNNLNGWSNQSMASVIPDGSFVACYYPSTEYTFRAIDRMVTTGISESKVINLKRLKNLDTKTNTFKSKFYNYNDTTPVSKQIFSLKGYKSRWTDEQISNYARGLNGKAIPFAPVTHTAIFINGHCFHLASRVLIQPTPSMRIVAYYPFKEKLLNKV